MVTGVASAARATAGSRSIAVDVPTMRRRLIIPGFLSFRVSLA
jgi:hypothetical protein